MVPLTLTFFVFLGVGALAVWLASRGGGRLADGGWGTLWAWVTGVLTFLAFLVVGFFTFAMIASLAAAPFNGLISEAVEQHLTGNTGEVRGDSRSAEVLRAALSAGKLLALEAGVMLPALVLLLVPVLGALTYAALAGFFLALNYLDPAMDRRRLGLRAKLAFCREHLPEALGFGLAVYVAMLVPLVNLLAVPSAAAGAAGMFVELRAPNPQSPQPPSPAAGPSAASPASRPASSSGRRPR